LEVPDEKTNLPLAPEAPALAVRIVIIPLEVEVPSPEEMLSAPPVFTVLRPEWILSKPPTPLVPLPAVILTSPPRPAVAAPLPKYNAPLLPVFEVPDENTNIPLPPAAPEFAVRIMIMPLEVEVPSPEAMLSTPPVFTVLRPE